MMSLLSHGLLAWISFYGGLAVGSRACHNSITGTITDPLVQVVNNKDSTKSNKNDVFNRNTEESVTNPYSSWITPTIEHLFAGASLVHRDDFMKQFDTGVPVDISTLGNEDILLLYGSPDALPTEPFFPASHHLPHFTNASQATQNCRKVKVILTQPSARRQCLALVGQWESYHVHNFMRIPPVRDFTFPGKNEYPLNDHAPLRYVARNQLDDGRVTHLPTLQQTLDYYDLLHNYLHAIPDTLERLRPLAQKAGSGPDHAIVVMVCNFGQAELLMNFVCHARAHHLSVDQVLIFATDADTYALTQSLQVNALNVQTEFGDLPTAAARAYGDLSFKGMMMAKVYSVHLVLLLGYHVLFQDVDVVWYRNPLAYFRDNSVPQPPAKPTPQRRTKLSKEPEPPESSIHMPFDMYFQDDGAHSPRYAPYSPNTGFYYVQYNWRTLYFFSTLARSGDLIQMSGSHQSSLNAILADHASSRGLRIKIFGRDDPTNNDFPGGFHYHRRKTYMKEMIQGQQHPYLFHMSWTKNKDNKCKFFQQMGDWYVAEQCRNVPVHQMQLLESSSTVVSTCCLMEPNVTCHYSDKPSVRPCHGSPKIDPTGRSFW
jgi:hypothetical protein